MTTKEPVLDALVDDFCKYLWPGISPVDWMVALGENPVSLSLEIASHDDFWVGVSQRLQDYYDQETQQQIRAFVVDMLQRGQQVSKLSLAFMNPVAMNSEFESYLQYETPGARNDAWDLMYALLVINPAAESIFEWIVSTEKACAMINHAIIGQIFTMFMSLGNATDSMQALLDSIIEANTDVASYFYDHVMDSKYSAFMFRKFETENSFHESKRREESIVLAINFIFSNFRYSRIYFYNMLGSFGSVAEAGGGISCLSRYSFYWNVLAQMSRRSGLPMPKKLLSRVL